MTLTLHATDEISKKTSKNWMKSHSVGDLKEHAQKSKAIRCKRKLGRNTEPTELQHLRLPINTGEHSSSTSPSSKSFTQKLQLTTITRQTHEVSLFTAKKHQVLQSEVSSSNAARHLLFLMPSTFQALAAEVEEESSLSFLSSK